jgi:hypothetical protein
MEPEGSLPCLQEPSTGPYLEPDQSSPYHPGGLPKESVKSNEIMFFYGEELLAPRTIPKLDDHPVSDVRDCLFNTFAATYLEAVPFNGFH